MKNPIYFHFPEDVESIFVLWFGLYHHLLHVYDSNNNWEEKDLIDEEDIMVEYDSLDQTDIVYEICIITFLAISLGQNSGYYI